MYNAKVSSMFVPFYSYTALAFSRKLINKQQTNRSHSNVELWLCKMNPQAILVIGHAGIVRTDVIHDLLYTGVYKVRRFVHSKESI